MGKKQVTNKLGYELDKIQKELSSNLSYSIRRYFVDEFFLRNIKLFNDNSDIIDLGGKKTNKRGYFNIEKYNLKVKYANISPDTDPDYLCDIECVPVPDNSFDGIVLSEVLEHVVNPIAVLKETYRILKPGGKMLICTPFNYHIHADPYDFARYTDFYFKKNLLEIGFTNIIIEKQGLFFSVIANMLKLYVNELLKENRPKSKIKQLLFREFVFWLQRRSFLLEKKDFYKKNWLFSGYTTGYGIVCKK